MKRSLWILIAHLFFLNVSLAQNQFIKHYTVADGLPTNSVSHVYQDSDGFMWFATDAGVTRFDGKNFLNFTTSDGLNDNYIKRIKEDNVGRLWFFNQNGTINYYYHNTIYNDKNAPFLNELKTNFFLFDFFQDSDSALYFYNIISEVFVIKDNTLIDYKNFGFKNQKEIGLFYLNKSSDGHFFLWTSPGIFEFKEIDDSLAFIPQSNALIKVFGKNDYESIGLDRSGYVNFYHNSEIIKERVLKFESSSQYVNSIVIDADGFIWLASYDKGIYCYKNDKVILHLDIECIQSLSMDFENNIWVASFNKGIYKINRGILKFNYLGKDSFAGGGITGIAPANDGGIWATNGNSMFLINGNKVSPMPLKMENNNLGNIYQFKNNTVIASSTGTYMIVIENVRYNAALNSIQTGKYGRLNFTVRKIAIDKSERKLYSYINNNVLIMDPENNFKCFVVPLKTGEINNVFMDNNNELIINTSKNYIYRDYKLYEKKSYEPLNGQIIKSHFIVDNENELFNAGGNKIFLLSNQKLFNLTNDFEFQIDYQIKDMVYSASTLFFFTVKTVYYISNPLKKASGGEIFLNKLNVEFNNINDLFCRDSTLYVASDDGLTMIPIKEYGNSPIVPAKPYFNNIFLDDKEIDFSSGSIDFKGYHKLSIGFASLNYSSLPIKYSYKLEGYDKNWAQVNEANVVYLNLPPGFYTFKLQSGDTMGIDGNTTQLAINIHPAFFQRTITLIAISLMLVLTLILLILYFKNMQLKQKETESQLLSLENKALQSMMNPHFIFNALGSIQSYLLQNKASEAGTYLSQFARLIRQNMNSLKSNSISIEDEVERLRNYMELEKFRMEAKFDFSIEVDDQLDSDEISIPSMIVQPFAENAVWHGISSLSGNGQINIRFEKNDEKSILVFIEDNGVGINKTSEFSKSAQHLNMGVGLTEKRLKLIGGRVKVKSEIITEELNPGLPNPGTRVKIVVPLSTGEYRI